MTSGVPQGRSVTVRVPAKINLELTVGPLRADGYHDLATVFHAVSLYDELIVEPAQDWTVHATGDFGALVPRGSDNLAVRAMQDLAHAAGVDQAARIEIRKQIPVAGGMAGGSADAAAALVAADALWGLATPRRVLDELAAGLGSDVPFALTGGTAMGSGRGERLAPVLTHGTFSWVLALSETGLSTPEVYAECDRLREGSLVADPRPSPGMMAALRSGSAAALGRALANDLQPAALRLRPELGDVVDFGMARGALGAVVSGSGPTVAFLTGGVEPALDLAAALQESPLASSVRRASGPVHGARVVIPSAERREHPAGRRS